MPWGRDRDHWLWEQRHEQIAERVSSPFVADDIDLPDEPRATYRKLLAISQPRPRAQGAAMGWRDVSVAELGADVRLVLDIAEPVEPAGGFNLTSRKAPEISAERIAAAQRLDRDLAELEQRGFIRWVSKPAWCEIRV